MADIFSKEKRSQIMSSVSSKGNKSTELRLIKIFKDNDLKGWRRNYQLFGNPDFVFLKYKLAIFTDGCFWHGHNCRNTSPVDNAEYWLNKISKNKYRDSLVTNKLISKGWQVIRFWECDLIKNRYFDKLNCVFKTVNKYSD